MNKIVALFLSLILLTVAVIACTCNPSPAPTEVPPERPTQGPTEALTPTPTTEPHHAGPSLGDTSTRPVDGMVMVYVPGGTFQMGSDESDSDASIYEFPQHPVTLGSFWIDRTEVSNAQYERCVEGGVCWPSGYAEDEDYGGGDHPVESVSWNDAATYCEWAGARLPTEAEWEYAARGSGGRIYPWGDETPMRELCNFDNNEGGTIATGSYPAGASWCGALDMAGNVFEWMADWYDENYYQDSPLQNPTGPATGDHKVLRGGSWGDTQEGIRAAGRYYHLPPDHRYGGVGFRCVSRQE